MMPLRRQTPAILLLCCALAFGLSACLARRRLIPRAAGSTPSLKIADFKSLLDALQHQYDAIQDFSATVDMVPALGSAEKNHITEYKDVRAYIRFRKPANIRLIGLLPVVRSQALGSAEKTHITEYKAVRAYIRFRKPANIRLIGLLPVVRSQASGSAAQNHNAEYKV